MFKALAAFGAPLAEITPADFADGSAFQIGQPPDRIDILEKTDGVGFDEAWPNRLDGAIDGDTPVHVISREDLIRNKLASGWQRDLLDVEILCEADQPKPPRGDTDYCFASLFCNPGT